MSGPDQSRWRRWWWREQFTPGRLGLLVNPFYHSRRGLWRAVRSLAPALTGEVLDVGCGRKPYRALIPATRYVGLDLDSPVTRALGLADVYYDGGVLPFSDASFDGVLCSEVLEHVFTPDKFLGEIRRVLRPGGRLLLTVPFVWDEHEQPQDFARYTSFGLRAVLERTGFAVDELRKSGSDARALAQLGAAWLYKVTRTRHRALNLAAQLALIAPVNIAGSFLGAGLPGNPDFYLDNVMLATRRV